MSHHMFIIGGSGSTGKAISPLLLKYLPDVAVVLMGRTESTLKAQEDALKAAQSSCSVIRCVVDAGKIDALTAAVRSTMKRPEYKTGTIVVASQFLGTVPLEVAIATRCNYLDINYNTAKVEMLKKLEAKVAESGICCVTDAGFHPGLLAPIALRAASYIPGTAKIRCGGMIRADWNNISTTPETEEEFYNEVLNGTYKKFINGKWIDCSVTSSDSLFPMRFSDMPQKEPHSLFPLFFREMSEVPKMVPSLRNYAFGIASWGKWFDYVMMPAVFLMSYIMPKKMNTKMFMWSLRRYASSPPFFTILRTEAYGIDDRVPSYISEVFHTDGYYLTAAAAVAMLLQMSTGMTKRGEIHLMGTACDTPQLFADLKKLGCRITETGSAVETGRKQ